MYFGILIRFLVQDVIKTVSAGSGARANSRASDPAEKQCEKSLDAAKYYFYKRKPDKNDKAAWERMNKSIESRLQEIVDTNPSFAHIDNVFFLLGELYHRSGDLEKAIQNWTIVVKEYPDSDFKSQAQKRLNETQDKNKEKKG